MELTAEQKQKVATWIEAGAKLSDIQQRMGEEFEIRMTYMEARFLMDDLKLSIKEAVVAEPVAPAADPGPGPEAIPNGFPDEPEAGSLPAPVGGGGVVVKLDTITRPGAMVSGTVTFSDGKGAAWYLDQTGRLGMTPDVENYRPTPADVEQFQRALEQQLAKLGI